MDIETFENPYPHRNYRITMRWPEAEVFDDPEKPSLPGVLLIEYIPDKYCLNRESLGSHLRKLAEADFFDPKILNCLLTDLVNSCKPRQMDVIYAPESSRSGKTALRRSYKKNDLQLRN